MKKTLKIIFSFTKSIKKNAYFLGAGFFIFALCVLNTTWQGKYVYTYQFNYPCQWFKDSHVLITQAYDYLKQFDPHFNRLNIWYESDGRGGAILGNEIIVPERLGKARCRRYSYGETINLTQVYHGVFGSRYFNTITAGGDGTFSAYNAGHFFNDIPPNAYHYIYHKDMVAIFSNDDKKHQTALNTLKRLHNENLTSEDLAKMSEREALTSEYVQEIAKEITIEVVEEQSFSSGLLSFKATIVRFHLPKFYKRYWTLGALKTGAVKLGDLFKEHR